MKSTLQGAYKIINWNKKSPGAGPLSSAHLSIILAVLILISEAFLRIDSICVWRVSALESYALPQFDRETTVVAGMSKPDHIEFCLSSFTM